MLFSNLQLEKFPSVYKLQSMTCISASLNQLSYIWIFIYLIHWLDSEY